MFIWILEHKVSWHVHSNAETVNSIWYTLFHENCKINLISGRIRKSHYPTALHSECENWVIWFLFLLIWYWPIPPKINSSFSKESMWWNEWKKSLPPNNQMRLLFSQSINIYKIFIRWPTPQLYHIFKYVSNYIHTF